MEEGKIVLDKKSFEALAVDSRVLILKALRERRKMLTELSGELKLSASSIKEHLDKLVDAGLVEKNEEGHKWKYYSLTKKGEQIVAPNRAIQVWILLGISFVVFAFSTLSMFSSPVPSSLMQATAESKAIADMAANESFVATAGAMPSALTTNNLPSSVSDASQPISLALVMAILSISLMALCTAYLVKKWVDERRSASR